MGFKESSWIRVAKGYARVSGDESYLVKATDRGDEEPLLIGFDMSSSCAHLRLDPFVPYFGLSANPGLSSQSFGIGSARRALTCLGAQPKMCAQGQVRVPPHDCAKSLTPPHYWKSSVAAAWASCTRPRTLPRTTM